MSLSLHQPISQSVHRPRRLVLGLVLSLTAAALVSLTAVQPAGAQNLIANGDFSQPGTNTYTINTVNNFVGIGDSAYAAVGEYGVASDNTFGFPGTGQFGYLNGTSSLTQAMNGANGTQANTLQPGSLYTFSGAVGYRSDFAPGGTNSQVRFPTLTFSLLVGGTVVASNIIAPPATPPYGMFVPFSFTYNSTGSALAGQTLSVSISAAPQPGASNQGDFTNLRLTAVPVPVVPEASTTVSLGLLLMLGLGGTVVARRRRKA